MKTFLKIAVIVFGISALSLAYAAPPQSGKERSRPRQGFPTVAQKPDLIVQLSGNCTNMSRLNIHGKVQNMTNMPVNAHFSTSIWIGVGSDPKHKIWIQHLPGLPAYGSEEFDTHIPAVNGPLDYKVEVVVDYEEMISEKWEHNNKDEVTISCRPKKRRGGPSVPKVPKYKEEDRRRFGPPPR